MLEDAAKMLGVTVFLAGLASATSLPNITYYPPCESLRYSLSLKP
jgi:hypothetical protein